MKKAIVAVFLLIIPAGCTKSETRYPDNESSRESVNNKQSDTLHNGGGKRKEVSTDNE